jgi:hypothetical protein
VVIIDAWMQHPSAELFLHGNAERVFGLPVAQSPIRQATS